MQVIVLYEKRLEKLKERLLFFQKNLHELKECLKDNNFDIAKEKMSIFKGNFDRPGTIPNYQYSDEDRENSFEVKQDNNNENRRRKTSDELKKMQNFL